MAESCSVALPSVWVRTTSRGSGGSNCNQQPTLGGLQRSGSRSSGQGSRPGGANVRSRMGSSHSVRSSRPSAAQGFSGVLPHVPDRLLGQVLAENEDAGTDDVDFADWFSNAVPLYAVETPPRWIPPWKKAVLAKTAEGSDCGSGWASEKIPGLASTSNGAPQDAGAGGSCEDATTKPAGGECQEPEATALADSTSSELFAHVLNRLIPAQHGSARDPKLRSKRGAPRLLEVAKVAQAANGVREFGDSMGYSTPSCASKCKEAPSATEAEMMAFRAALTKMYGNLPRAFEAMLRACFHAPGSKRRGPNDGPTMSLQEFEWCVIAYIKVGDKSLAHRIFNNLDADGDGEIALRDLVPQGSTNGLLTLIELRRLLLSRYPSLAHAFRELEDNLEMELNTMRSRTEVSKRGGRAGRAVRLTEFTKAASFLGMEAHQASHFYQCLDKDGDGRITIDEFLEALSTMPREVLLQDFRKRLLTRCPSLAEAIKELTKHSGDSSIFTRQEFVSAISRFGVLEVEALELFRIFDLDGSCDVSVDEVREALREVAPTTDLEGFWHRFMAEWPDMGSSILGRRKQRRHSRLASNAVSNFSALLHDLLPQDLIQACTCPTWRQMESEKPRLALLTAEAFDVLAQRLDISRKNASELFAQIVSAGRCGKQAPRLSGTLPQLLLPGTLAEAEPPTTARQQLLKGSRACGRGLGSGSQGVGTEEQEMDAEEDITCAQVAGPSWPGGSPSLDCFGGDGGDILDVCYVDEFLEQLELWISNPLVRVGATAGHSWARQNAAQVAGPAKVAVSALKAELVPEQTSNGKISSCKLAPAMECDKLPSVDRKRRRCGLRVPWTFAQPASSRWMQPTPRHNRVRADGIS